MDEQPQQDLFRIPLEYHVPDDMLGRYATNLVVQHTNHEFIVSFFEAHPPMLLGSPKEIRAELEKVGAVRANCIARIIIAAGEMPEFVQVLRDNLEKYREPEKTE